MYWSLHDMVGTMRHVWSLGGGMVFLMIGLGLRYLDGIWVVMMVLSLLVVPN